MKSTQRALDIVAPYCDIVDRLDVIPPEASVRGFLFKSIEAELVRCEKIDQYRSLFPDDRWSSVPYYPLSDYLIRAASAGALVTSPKAVHEGMFMIARGNASAFAASLIGRAMLRLLARDPVKLTEQALAARRQTMNYGKWRLDHDSAQGITMSYRDEYQWIESLAAGAAAGTFAACGLKAEVSTRLDDRFNGATTVRW